MTGLDDDVDLHWKAEGPFRGTATLLHGVTGLADTWWQVGPGLAAAGWDVSALDLPGHGDRAAGLDPLTQSVMVQDVAGRLPEMGTDLLVGHSMGGVVAAGVAAARPDLVRALALEDPAGWRGEPDRELAARIREDCAAARVDPSAATARSRAANPTWADQDVAADVAGKAATDVAAVAGGAEVQLCGDLLSALRQVTVPVLLLLSEPARSALHAPERAAVAALVPPPRVVDLPAGHAVHRDLPGHWVDAVAAFGTSAVAAA